MPIITAEEAYRVKLDFESITEVGSMLGSGGVIVIEANIDDMTRRVPNLQRIRTVMGGVQRRLRVCTRCLRSGKVAKPTPAKKTTTSAA